MGFTRAHILENHMTKYYFLTIWNLNGFYWTFRYHLDAKQFKQKLKYNITWRNFDFKTTKAMMKHPCKMTRARFFYLKKVTRFLELHKCNTPVLSFASDICISWAQASSKHSWTWAYEISSHSYTLSHEMLIYILCLCLQLCMTNVWVGCEVMKTL